MSIKFCFLSEFQATAVISSKECFRLDKDHCISTIDFVGGWSGRPDDSGFPAVQEQRQEEKASDIKL